MYMQTMPVKQSARRLLESDMESIYNAAAPFSSALMSHKCYSRVLPVSTSLPPSPRSLARPLSLSLTHSNNDITSYGTQEQLAPIKG